MKSISTSFLLLICIVIGPHSLHAMRKSKQPNSPCKRELENKDSIDQTHEALQSPEKKTRTIKRTIKHLTWQEALITGTQLPTLTPQEHDETVTVEVDPLVEAVYNDDALKLKQILETESPNLLFYTHNVIQHQEAATLLDIAAERQSYQCLEYLETILSLRKPELNLRAQVCHTIAAQQSRELTHQAQLICPELDLSKCAHHGTNIHLYYNVAPKVVKLYATSEQSATRIARHTGDIRCAQLLNHPLVKQQQTLNL